MASVTLIIAPYVIFSVVNITNVIIICHIETPINYRIAVPDGSDFSVISPFREVYHVEGTGKAPFSGGERAVTGQGRGTIYSVFSAADTATFYVERPLRAVGAEADPELVFFGSAKRGRRIIARELQI
ncbi:hypothetical protein ABLU99_24445 [Klebsiella sp. JN_Kp123]|uniref:hypothetical protein n=1 Tax=Klebsiella sp. JN_Kp123 TaxID=3153436 RepID=UPI0032B5FF9B